MKKRLWFLDEAKFKYDNKIIEIKDIVNYYINLNNSKENTISYFNISQDCFDKVLKHYNIKKPKKLAFINRSKNWNLKSTVTKSTLKRR